MSKQALVSLPLLALVFIGLVGCPAGQQENDPPADRNAAVGADGVKPSAAPGDEIFVGWTKPKLAIVITGEMDGYLEPCGCAGLENQKGGLSRRHTFLSQLERDGWPLVAVDLGGSVRRYGRQAELQYELTANALAKMGYAAVGFGLKDLRLPEGLAAVVNNDQDHRLIAANVSVLEMTKPFRVVEAGGMKVGITAILGEEYCAEIKNDLVTLKSPRAAWPKSCPKCRRSAIT